MDKVQMSKVIRLERKSKLARGVVECLVRAGLERRLDIRLASDEQLLAIPGIEEGDVAEIRRKIG